MSENGVGGAVTLPSGVDRMMNMNAVDTMQTNQNGTNIAIPAPAAQPKAKGFEQIWLLGKLVSLTVRSYRAKQALEVADVDANTAKASLPIVKLGQKELFVPEMLETLRRLESRARHVLSEHSHPFPVGNARFVPLATFAEVKAKLDGLIAQFDEAAKEFVAKFDEYKFDMLAQYPGQLKASDYPKKEDLKFEMEYVSFTLNPDASETEEKVRNALKEFVHGSLTNLRRRVLATVGLACDRITARQPVTERHLASLRTMVETFERNDFVGDAAIKKALTGLRGLIDGVDAKVLGGDEERMNDLKRALDIVTEAASAEDVDDVVSAFTGRSLEVGGAAQVAAGTGGAAHGAET